MPAKPIQIRKRPKKIITKKSLATKKTTSNVASKPIANKANVSTTKKVSTPKSKYKLDDILVARATIGEAYDKVKRIEDTYDKLTVLKTAYYEAIKVVPDPIKRDNKWRLIPMNEYQAELVSKHTINAYSPKPNRALESELSRRQKELSKFQTFSLRHGHIYIDDLMLVDQNFNALNNVDILQFSTYLTPYYNFLQSEFKKLHKPLDNFQVKNDL